ncbi:MAG: sugar ABC transporter substrate-binding protein [Anaerolineae bacterium]|nr:sugar ABC transporter substrate-binding protein [Anaerolineae bacterium]
MPRFTRLLCCLLLTALIIGTVATPTSAQQPVKLVFRQFDPPVEIEGLKARIDAWNKDNPGIQVTLETVPPAEWLNQYVREAQAGGGPDIQHVGFVNTIELARAGLIIPLDDLIKASKPGAGLEDFLGRDLGELDGKMYALPWTVDTFALVYNQEAFAAAGITTFPDTWADLLETAKKLTADRNKDGRIDQNGFCFPAGGGTASGLWFIVNYYLWSRDKFFVQQNASTKAWEVGVTPEDLVDAINYFNSYFEANASPRSMIALSNFNDPEIINSVGRGDCAIGFFPPNTQAAAQKASKSTLLSGPIPQGPTRRISHLGGRSLVINKNSKNPNEAWKFINYLIDAETFKTYNQFPAQKALFDKVSFKEAQKGYVTMLPLAITFRQYITSPAPVSGLIAAVQREFSAVFSGQKQAQQAATDLITALNDLIAKK